ncbi:FAD-dependent oxidoreductase [Streptomyces sp. AK08-01B]|nr:MULTISPECIES: FAD-dependent oxidoreductase [unclassified Streptomyces]MDX3767886.1 FAD-dependent oxidoreductase [Streptomyces sp. AK08-01B]MDX3818113.1 FAD-dependent oxidoreductase [Streptomyces sp. AK08-01A]
MISDIDLDLDRLPEPPGSGRAPFRAPSHSDFTAAGRTPSSVVVLGAGMAGLTAAYELRKAGYDCHVLEAKARAGGRVWTVRSGDAEQEIGGPLQRAQFADDQYFEAGAARMTQSMVTIDYCRELGVAIEPFISQNADAYVYRQPSPFDPSTAVRMRTARADVYGYLSELLATAVDTGGLDHRLSAHDKAHLIDLLRAFGEVEPTAEGWRYPGSTRRGLDVEWGAADRGATPLRPLPSLSQVLSGGLGHYLTPDLEHEKSPMLFQPIGGMDSLVSALVASIGEERVHLRSEVTEILSADDHVRVTYRDEHGTSHQHFADYCVAALQPHLMARISHNLGPSVASALSFPVPRPAFKIGLEYPSRWWETEERIYGGVSETNMDLQHVWYPSHGFHSARGIVTGYSVKEGAGTLGAEMLEGRVRRALEQGSRIHGRNFTEGLSSSFSVAWHRVPFIEAAWVIWPSYTSGEYELLCRPAGRVYFAGDWLSHLIAWQAGAIESARVAVSAIHHRTLSVQPI